MSTTGREGSAWNIRKEKYLWGMERKMGKKCQNKEVIKIGKNDDMYKMKFTSPVSQVSNREEFFCQRYWRF